MLVIYDGKKKAIAYLKKPHRRNRESETYAQKFRTVYGAYKWEKEEKEMRVSRRLPWGDGKLFSNLESKFS